MLTRLSGAPPGAGRLCCCQSEWWSGWYQLYPKSQTCHSRVPAHIGLRLESSCSHWENPIENPLTFATLLWVLKLYYLLFKKEFHESGEKSWNCGWTASLIDSLSKDFCGSKFEAELQLSEHAAQRSGYKMHKRKSAAVDSQTPKQFV